MSLFLRRDSLRHWSSVMFSSRHPVGKVRWRKVATKSMGNSAKLNILYGESDAHVSASQKSAIEQAGHQVQTADNRKGVEAALKAGKFDLVILGATLTRDDRHHLPYMVKKFHPGLKVLVLHADGGRHPSVDANVDTGSSIKELVEKIAAMMAQNAQKSSAKAAGR